MPRATWPTPEPAVPVVHGIGEGAVGTSRALRQRALADVTVSDGEDAHVSAAVALKVANAADLVSRPPQFSDGMRATISCANRSASGDTGPP